MPEQKELSKLFEEYILDCKYTRQLRADTLKSYTDVFKGFMAVMPEVTTPKDIEAQTLPIFYRRLATRERPIGKKIVRGPLKPSSIKTYHSKLMAFFRWLERYNYLTSGITDKIASPPMPKYEDERALTDSEVSKLLATISVHTANDSFQFQRDMLIITFCLYSGLRRRELLGLQVQDIDRTSRTIRVNANISKSKKDRYIPLHPELLQRLDIHLKERMKRGLKCPHIIISTRQDKPLSVYGLKHWVERYRALSGVRFHIHQTRHTFACSLAKSGADISTIMKALGHSTTQMTERYLRSITPEHARSFIEKLSY